MRYALFMCKGYLCVTLHSVVPNASSVWNDYQTHMREGGKLMKETYKSRI